MKTFISDLILLDGIETDFDFIFQSQKISNLCRSSDSLSYWFLQAAYLTIIPHADELKRFKLIIPNKEMIFFCISWTDYCWFGCWSINFTLSWSF